MIISLFCFVPPSLGAMLELVISGNWSLDQAVGLIANMALVFCLALFENYVIPHHTQPLGLHSASANYIHTYIITVPSLRVNGKF